MTGVYLLRSKPAGSSFVLQIDIRSFICLKYYLSDLFENDAKFPTDSIPQTRFLKNPKSLKIQKVLTDKPQFHFE